MKALPHSAFLAVLRNSAIFLFPMKVCDTVIRCGNQHILSLCVCIVEILKLSLHNLKVCVAKMQLNASSDTTFLLKFLEMVPPVWGEGVGAALETRGGSSTIY